MSLLFGKISKLSCRSGLCFRQDAFRRDSFRWLSSSSTPYVFDGPGRNAGDGGRIRDFALFDPRKEELVKLQDVKLPEELFRSRIVGSSHGWVANVRQDDFTVHLSNMFNPSASSHKVISLPSINSPVSPAGHVLRNVSLSCSPDDKDQECVVAVKFWGPCVSFFRPGGDSKWTYLETDSRLFSSSRIMYSKRRQSFIMASTGSHYIGALDLKKIESHPMTYYSELNLRNLPKMAEAEWEELLSCYRSEHLVESPTGESFIVMWYVQTFHDTETMEEGSVFTMLHETKRFMVFREDKDGGEACYTDDIGDLCIFVGLSEAFCLPASLYPGLKPNSIYFIRYGGCASVYDIASHTIHKFTNPDTGKPMDGLCWLAPLQ